MLVPDALGLEILLILRFIDFLEDILEPAIISLKDGVLCAHVQRHLAVESELEAGVGETLNGFRSVVLGLSNTAALGEIEDLDDFRLATLGGEDHFESALFVDDTVLGAVLVAEGVTADDDGLFPARYQTGNAGNDDGGAEDGSTAGESQKKFLEIEWVDKTYRWLRMVPLGDSHTSCHNVSFYTFS